MGPPHAPGEVRRGAAASAASSKPSESLPLAPRRPPGGGGAHAHTATAPVLRAAAEPAGGRGRAVQHSSVTRGSETLIHARTRTHVTHAKEPARKGAGRRAVPRRSPGQAGLRRRLSGRGRGPPLPRSSRSRHRGPGSAGMSRAQCPLRVPHAPAEAELRKLAAWGTCPSPCVGHEFQPVDLQQRQEKVLMPFSHDRNAVPRTEILLGSRNVPLRDLLFS